MRNRRKAEESGEKREERREKREGRRKSIHVILVGQEVWKGLKMDRKRLES